MSVHSRGATAASSSRPAAGIGAESGALQSRAKPEHGIGNPMGMNSGAGALVWEVLRHVEAGRGVRGGFQTMQIGGRERTYLVHLPRLAPADATRVRRSTLGPCSRGSEVTLYSIEGGGHGWPGTSPRLRLLLGPVSRQIDTTQASWEFFERHPRR